MIELGIARPNFLESEIRSGENSYTDLVLAGLPKNGNRVAPVIGRIVIVVRVRHQHDVGLDVRIAETEPPVGVERIDDDTDSARRLNDEGGMPDVFDVDVRQRGPACQQCQEGDNNNDAVFFHVVSVAQQ